MTRTRARCDYGRCLGNQMEIEWKIKENTSRGNYSVYSSEGGNYNFIGMFNRSFVGYIALDPNDLDIFQVTLSYSEPFSERKRRQKFRFSMYWQVPYSVSSSAACVASEDLRSTMAMEVQPLWEWSGSNDCENKRSPYAWIKARQNSYPSPLAAPVTKQTLEFG